VAIQLEVLSAGMDPAPTVVINGRRASLGRGAHCDVRIPDPSVSSLHASIIKRGNNYLLTDEGSQFGTGVGTSAQPVWLAPDSPRVLSCGEHIWLGQIELRVRLVEPQRGAQDGLEDLARTLVHAGLSAAGLNPTSELVERTLVELTELPDEEIPLPPPEDPSPLRVGVADLFDEDKHPPWKTDLFIAGLALLVTSGCALLYFHLTSLS